MSTKPQEFISALQFDSAGLIPVVVQDVDSKEILMLAWMNSETLALTIDTRVATYFSRSRQEVWVKGATSGNTQQVHSVARDCDGDALVMQVHQTGVACHTGTMSCFETEILELS